MARYGSGYFTDWESMSIALNKGLKQALTNTCERMCEECNQMIRGGIYTTYQPTEYERTFEMNDDLLTYKVDNGLNAQFIWDKKVFSQIEIDGAHHHGLEDLDLDNFMKLISEQYHDEFLNDVRDYIQKNFKRIYQEECRKLGFSL